MQNKRDAEQKGCRTGGIHYRRGAGQEECRTEGIQNRRDEGQEGCSRFRNIYQFDLMVLERRSEMSVFNFVHIMIFIKTSFFPIITGYNTYIVLIKWGIFPRHNTKSLTLITIATLSNIQL